MESDTSGHELHQIHQIETLQDLSMEQLSFISHHPLDNTNNRDEELIPWDDLGSDTDGSVTLNQSLLEDQEEHSHLGDLPPGQGT
jgi:hypothetical protein